MRKAHPCLRATVALRALSVAAAAATASGARAHHYTVVGDGGCRTGGAFFNSPPRMAYTRAVATDAECRALCDSLDVCEA